MSDEEKRLAVYLADEDAERPAHETWATVDVDCLLERVRRNKVPLLTSRCLRPDAPVWESAAFAAALAEDEASLERQRTEFTPVREALDAAEIPSALIKSAGIAPSFPYRSDNVDLLVPAAMGQRAAAILYGLGYVELRNIEEPRKFLFKRFAGGTEVSAIHLHEQVGWGTGFLVEDGLWKRVRASADDPLVTLLSPEDAVLVTLAHAFYEDKEFKIWDLVKVRHCIGESIFDWDYCAWQASERGWLQGLNVILGHASRVERQWFANPRLPHGVGARHLEGESNSAWRRSSRMLRPNPNAAEHLPAPVPFLYSKRHYFAKVARDKRLTAGQKADDALRHALAGVRRNLGLFSQRRMLIALSGVDGSGKTVHAEALKSAFDRCDIRARIVWSRGASSPLTDATIRLGKRLMGGQRSGLASANDVVDRGAALWRRPLVRRVWPWVLAFDLWRQYLGSVAWPLLRGRVVIADRYVADAQAEVAAYLDEAGAPGMPLALRVLERVSPRPAVRFLLDVPPEVAAARKGGEENSDFLQRRATHYRQIAAGPGWRVMDATQPLEDLSSEIVRTVLLRYFHRYRTTFNALFLFNPRAKRPFLEPH